MKIKYKCRLCGDVFSDSGGGPESCWIGLMIAIGYRLDRNGAGVPPRTTKIHSCKDGSHGVADLIGAQSTVGKPAGVKDRMYSVEAVMEWMKYWRAAMGFEAAPSSVMCKQHGMDAWAAGLEGPRINEERRESQADINMRNDRAYAPYCMRCDGLVRMRRVSATLAQCDLCNALHDIEGLDDGV